MVVFDATTLLCLLDPEAKAPTDPETGLPVIRVKERIEFLVRELEKGKEKIIVPTPALSELLVRAGDAGPEYLDILGKAATFKIANFDQRAAVEVAAVTRDALDAGDKRGGSESAWAKIKFDRQIIAIAKVERASTIYSDDGDIRPPRIYFFLARKRLNSSQNRRFLDVSSDEGGFGLLDNCEEMYL